MRLLKNRTQPTDNRKSAPTPVSAPLDTRRHSKVLTSIIEPVDYWKREDTSKRPSIAIMPQDSAASLPTQTSHRRLHSSGPYCPKRPKLRDILANTAEEPWTLDAFTSYCEQNLCAENLKFLQEAARYATRYMEWSETDKPSSDIVDPLVKARNQVKVNALSDQWRNIIADYITSGGAQELNVESRVRNAMLTIPEDRFPPCPDELDEAVRVTHKLIEDSVLFSFINDVQPSHPSDENLDTQVHPEPPLHKPHSLQIFPGSRPSSRDNGATGAPPHASSFSGVTSYREKARSQFIPDQPKNRNLTSAPRNRPYTMFPGAVPKEHSSSSSESPGIDGLVLEESTSALASPMSSNTTTRSLTPPTSPPASEVGHSARDRSDSGVKNMWSKLGFNKRKQSGSRLSRPSSTVIDESSSSRH